MQNRFVKIQIFLQKRIDFELWDNEPIAARR